MKILYHHRTRGAAVEGVHIRSIANALRKMGHQVDIMSFPGADPDRPPDSIIDQTKIYKHLSQTIIRVITKKLPEFLFEFLELSYNVYTFFRLGRYIRKNRPDAIYERYSLYLFISVVLANRNNIPIVLEINDSALLDRVRPLFFKRLVKFIEKRVFQNCSGLVFISSFFQRTATNAYGAIAPSIISPNAADIDLFAPDKTARIQYRKQYNIDDKVVCGFVGAFLPWHGIDVFVRTISVKLAENPQLILLLVGDGPLYQSTRELISATELDNQVIFTGRVPHDQVPCFMACMDFAILPDSNTYGSPMKLFELMATETPVVCPDYSPIAEVVENNRTGWLFTPHDIDAAVELTIALSRSPDEIMKAGKAAREYIRSHRQWVHNAHDLLDLYRRLGAPL